MGEDIQCGIFVFYVIPLHRLPGRGAGGVEWALFESWCTASPGVTLPTFLFQFRMMSWREVDYSSRSTDELAGWLGRGLSTS